MKSLKKILALVLTAALIITACTIGFTVSAEDCIEDIVLQQGAWSNGATGPATLVKGQNYSYSAEITYYFCSDCYFIGDEIEGTIITYSLIDKDNEDAYLPSGNQMILSGEPVSGQKYKFTIEISNDLPAGNYDIYIKSRAISCCDDSAISAAWFIPFSVVEPTSSGALPAQDIGTYGAYHVSCFSAQLRLTFANGIHKYVDEVGFYIGTSPDNLNQVREVGKFHPETTWYTTSEWGIDLEPSTTYYYKIYYVLSADGKTYECPLKSFTTLDHTDGSWQTVAEATCITEGKQIKQCTECNKIIDIKTISNNGKHNEGVWKVDFEATADHDGQMSRYCTFCNTVLEQKTFGLHDHTEGYTAVIRNATCTEEGMSGTFCDICGACYETSTINAEGHGVTASATTVVPSCTQTGETSDYCTECGLAVSTAEIEALGHDEGVWTSSKEATCKDGGERVRSCTRCGEIIESETTEALGHDDGVWTSSKEATCKDGGERVRSCTRCGEIIESETTEALGHDDGVWTSSKDATCEADGEEVKNCTRCGEIIESKTIDALGHDDGVWKVDFEATADHDGQMSKYCTRCDMVLESKEFSLHTHTYGHTETLIPAGCLTKGETGKICATCGVVYETQEIDALDHAYSIWSKNNNSTHSRTCTRCHAVEVNNCSYTDTITQPTCTEGGYTTHVCDVCTFSYVDAYTQALGHNWSAWTECDDGCCHERECLREGCDETEEADHNWGEWVYNEDGKFFCNGTKTRVCPDCGANETEEAHHTSWICRVFYPIILFVGNIVHKLIYAVSLNWLFSEITIYPHI